jgi:hypothetical protein
MNQHLLVKIRQLGTPHRCVANLGNRLAKAGPMSGAIALGLTSDWRLDLDGPALRVRRSGIFPTQLNDPELIRGSLNHFNRL